MTEPPSKTDAAPSSATPERDHVLLAATSVFALFSVLATIAVVSGASFRALCIAYAVALPIALFLLVRHWRAEPTPSSSRGDRLSLWLLCAVSSLLAFAEHRPNQDDAYYFGGRTIYYLANPNAVVDLIQHGRALLDWPAEYPLVLLQHVSLFWAAIALATGLPGLAVVHFIAPAIGGALLPLAWHAAILRFARTPRSAAVGTAIVLACLALDGANGFGWLGFPALRLGKGMLMMIGVPLFVAWSKDWFDRPCASNLSKLAILAAACAGLSDSALFLLPVLALFMSAGALAAHGLSVGAIKAHLGFGASLGWMLGVGLAILAMVGPAEMALLGFGYGFPDSFGGQFTIVFGAPPGFFFWSYVAGLSIALWMLRGDDAGRFLAGWTAASVLVLNPVLFGPITQVLTSYNGYWRLFYLPPLLLGAGLAASLATQRWVRPSAARAAAITAGILCVAGVATWIGPLARSAIFAQVPLSLHGYKIDARVERDVLEIVEHAPPGPMLSPMIYSQTIPLYSARHPQVAVRGYMLRHAAILHGAQHLARSRLAAIDHVTIGRAPGGRDGLVSLLENEDLVSVVVTKRRRARVRRLLSQHGFEEVWPSHRFSLFVRQRADRGE